MTAIDPPAVSPGPEPPPGKESVNAVWKFVNAAFATVSRSIATGALLVVSGVYVYQLFRPGSIMVAPLELPQQLATTGLNARELTERLLDRIDSLREAARPTADQVAWTIDTPVEYPSIEIPGIRMSLPALMTFLNGTFGHHAIKVAWDLSARPKAIGTNPAQWLVTAVVTGGRLHQAIFTPERPDSALSVIAAAILADADPYTAIRALSLTGQCDDARTLAAGKLAIAHSRRDRVVANTMMG
ncbi:MAG: hypothetical protein ACREPM_03395, partial [Gemmatimonadaceae bacterium]